MAITKKVWPDHHEDALKKIAAMGNLSASDIMRKLNDDLNSNYSRNAVIGKMTRLGLSLNDGRPKQPRSRKVGGVGPSGTAIAANLKRREEMKSAPDPAASIQEPQSDTNVIHADLEEGMCAWPVRDGFYCGGGTGSKRVSYCAAHKRQSLDRPRMARYNENYQKSRSVIKKGRTFRAF